MAATDILTDKAIKAAIKAAGAADKARRISDGGGLTLRCSRAAPAGGGCATGSRPRGNAEPRHLARCARGRVSAATRRAG